MDLRLAFAVNNNNEFENKHFGQADKFLIYKLNSGSLDKESEEVNTLKSYEQNKKHGIRKKGEAIIDLLQSRNVNILVARQFGENISIINAHFIPVVIAAENPTEASEILLKHFSWILDEWEKKSSGYKLFTIKGGILKSAIHK